MKWVESVAFCDDIQKERFMELIKAIELKPPTVIKPNWGTSLCHTESEIIDWTLEAVNSNAVIVESYGWSRSKEMLTTGKMGSKKKGDLRKSDIWFLEWSGIGKVLEKHDVPFINLTEEHWRHRTVESETIKEKVERKHSPVSDSDFYSWIPEKLVDTMGADFLSLSKLRLGLQNIPVSLSVKNLFGMIPRPSRWRYHGKKNSMLDTSIVDIYKVYDSLFNIKGIVEAVFSHTDWDAETNKMRVYKDLGFAAASKNPLNPDVVVTVFSEKDPYQAHLKQAACVLGEWSPELVMHARKKDHFNKESTLVFVKFLPPSLNTYLSLMKKLEGLRWVPTWTSHMGCIKGCLNYLGIDVPLSWIFGGTGHAFVINISPDSCPSGPTAWRYEMIFKLSRNLGYYMDGIWAHKTMPDFKEKRKQGWMHIKTAIDESIPCYGWEIGIPEFQNITGYDETGYYFVGPPTEVEEGPRSWNDLGETEIGFFELYSVHPGKKAKVETIIHETFEYVQRQVKGKYKFDNYYTGSEAFEKWANGVSEGKSDLGGLGYNTEVWRECRMNAVGFLKEAMRRIGKHEALFDKAIKHYEEIVGTFNELRKLYPFDQSNYGKLIEENESSTNAVRLLHEAGAAEKKGLESLENILSVI